MDKSENNRFSKNLKLLRKSYGETMPALAAYLQVDTSTISRWESGGREPDHETLKRIAEHYRVTVDDLLKSNSINPNTNALSFCSRPEAF